MFVTYLSLLFFKKILMPKVTLEEARENLRRRYDEIEKAKQARRIIVIEDPSFTKTKVKKVEKSPAISMTTMNQKCTALTMKGTPCPWNSIECGLCKKHLNMFSQK